MAALARPIPDAPASPAALPVIVVGCGPVGARFAMELRRRSRDIPIEVFGAEETLPYNRVRLSSVLAGEAPWSRLAEDIDLPDDALTRVWLGCRIASIDRTRKAVIDMQGRVHAYAKLVLATGSTPHVPRIEGIQMKGVFTFRDFADAQRLLARCVRSRRTVVIGGGLLGLEAARAMRRHRTEVTVVEHASRLMPQQLDAAAAAILRSEVEHLGIRVHTDATVAAVGGPGMVESVALRDGTLLPCDTVIVAAGIRPAVSLALDADLSVGGGVRVDDQLSSSDPDIFAIGECAEHRGRVHGLVGPGYEQAAVAAHVITGGEAAYTGTVSAARLKVLGCSVFSMGETATEALPDFCTAHVYRDARHGVYRKVVAHRGRIVGAMSIGPWEELAQVQQAVLSRSRLWPWEALRLKRLGRFANAPEADDVARWPATAIVCNCTGVTRGRIGEAIAAGACSVPAVCSATGASSVCGSCRPLVAELVGARTPAQATPTGRWLAGLALTALVASTLLALLPSVPYAWSVDLPVAWDWLWRQSIAKQVSGYTLLALMAGLAALSLRKRVRNFTWRSFDGWRVIHVATGLATAFAIVAHTGGRMGANLTMGLAALALAALATGGGLGALVALEHRVPAPRARRWRSRLAWSHLLVLWPLPILLGFHIVQAYFF